MQTHNPNAPAAIAWEKCQEAFLQAGAPATPKQLNALAQLHGSCNYKKLRMAIVSLMAHAIGTYNEQAIDELSDDSDGCPPIYELQLLLSFTESAE